MPLTRAACTFFILAACLPCSAEAAASDYVVSYAIDAGEIDDWGKAACDYKSVCKIESRLLKLSIFLAFGRSEYREVTIWISGKDSRWDCCYFPDGVASIKRGVLGPVRVYVYEGRRHERNQFLFYEPIGILYLQFLEMR